MVDAALHLDLVSPEDLEERPRRRADRGVGGCVRHSPSWTLGPSHCGSPCSDCCTSSARSRWRRSATLTDADGVFVATADLWLVGTTALHEYDGDEHEKAPRRVVDRRRDRRVDRIGYVRRGFTSGDVLYRPVTILEDADRSLGRPHDPTRIRTVARIAEGLVVHPCWQDRVPSPTPGPDATAAYCLTGWRRIALTRVCTCDVPPPRRWPPLEVAADCADRGPLDGMCRHPRVHAPKGWRQIALTRTLHVRCAATPQPERRTRGEARNNPRCATIESSSTPKDFGVMR